MYKFNFNKKTIEKHFKECEKLLFDKNKILKIKYINFNHLTFDECNQDLLTQISNNSIVYCIWVGDSKNTFTQKYIGHAESKISRQRIRNHLTKKNERTGAQLERVIEILKQKKSVGISIVIIDPPYMRKALEEWLIANHSSTLDWNKNGKKGISMLLGRKT